MRSIGYDQVIDYQKEDFTKRGERYDAILDTKTNRSPFDYARALNPGGTYATVGGTSRALHCTARTLDWRVEQEEFLCCEVEAKSGPALSVRTLRGGQTCTCHRWTLPVHRGPRSVSSIWRRRAQRKGRCHHQTTLDCARFVRHWGVIEFIIMVLRGENGTAGISWQIAKSSWFCSLSRHFRFFFSGFTIGFRLVASTMSRWPIQLCSVRMSTRCRKCSVAKV